MPQPDPVALALALRQTTLPWAVGRQTEWGWQLEARFHTYSQAAGFAVSLRQAWNLGEQDISVSREADGAGLWPLEVAINRCQQAQQLEEAKLTPNPDKLKVYREGLTRLYEEAALLCFWHGHWLKKETREGKARLTFGAAMEGPNPEPPRQSKAEPA